MATRQPTILDALNIDHALEFSYRAHHSERLDYLCVFRSTALTIKAYFFDEGSDDELVVPHTHRYDFSTLVVWGGLWEARYTEAAHTDPWRSYYDVYTYSPVIDGGVGFSKQDAIRCLADERTRYSDGDTYRNRAHVDIHTLLGVEPGTILLLTQYADSCRKQTHAFQKIGKPAPSTAGMYERMTRAQVLSRAEQLQVALDQLSPA